MNKTLSPLSIRDANVDVYVKRGDGSEEHYSMLNTFTWDALSRFHGGRVGSYSTNNSIRNNYRYNSNLIWYCQIGSGDKEITPETTTIEGRLGAAQCNALSNRATVEGVDDPGFVHETIGIRYVFSTGAIQGLMTTVALASSSSGNISFGTQLKDGEGNPVTVPVGADDQVVVDYTIQYRRMGNADSSLEEKSHRIPLTLDGVDYELRITPPFLRLNDGGPYTGDWVTYIQDSENHTVYTYPAGTLPYSQTNSSHYTTIGHNDRQRYTTIMDADGGGYTRTIVVFVAGNVKLPNDELAGFRLKSSYNYDSDYYELFPPIPKPEGQSIRLTISYKIRWRPE